MVQIFNAREDKITIHLSNHHSYLEDNLGVEKILVLITSKLDIRLVAITNYRTRVTNVDYQPTHY